MFWILACTTANHEMEIPTLDSPSDDPSDYEVDTTTSYTLQISEPRWVVPSDSLPTGVEEKASNNNVDITFFRDRLYLAWRSSPTHFAGEETEMWVISSPDMGQSWALEHQIALEADVREPRFLVWEDELQLIMFEAGTNPLAFEPLQMWRTFRLESGDWSQEETFGPPETVPWDVKARNGKIWMTTYDGEHYGDGDVYVRFWESEDGRNWSYVNDRPYVYVGGVSEVAFEFTASGDLWAVGRNEDGDDTGAGTNICFASANDLSDWTCSAEADPERYDSPELFRHGDDIYMAARRDVGGPFGPEGDLLAYSLRPKRSALYRLN
ncbi:MAG: hypothetical protein VX278_01180, partial [Myxococcota bacterium]|nr:hypothetical protein [Myxococcota bacterium]